MSTELILTRGIQGCGKTTWAKAQVRRANGDIVRVNRDDLRMMVFGAYWLDGDFAKENAITKIQHAAIRAALSAHKSVIVDDTNLRVKTVNELRKIAVEFAGDVQFRIQDFEVDVAECIRRDADRIAKGERGVGEQVIKDTAKRYLSGSSLPRLDAKTYALIESNSSGSYVEDESLPSAWLVDVDGTLASMTGRSPYDWKRVDEDAPIQHVIDLVKTLKSAGHTIIIMSGRDGSAETLTRDWLDVYEVPFDHIFMRANNDMRKDNVVKDELFEANIRGKFYVRGILDDRDQVVKMWREKGLFVAQVNYGAF